MTPKPPKADRSVTRPGASPDGLPPLKEVIAKYQLTAKKNLGQNFLLDLNLTRRIARVAAPLTDKTVIEVGPGPGGLTRALLLEGAKRVVAIERDERCLPALEAISEANNNRLVVHNDDATKMDWAVFAGQFPGPKVIIANLPYGVATVLLIQWLESPTWPPWYDRMILMFQKEVGERIVAGPNTKAYGRLAVMTQWRCEPRIILTLGPQAFTPPPKISSVVVDFRPLRQLEQTCSPEILGRVTAAAFGQRRKMLRSSLKTLTPNVDQLLEGAGLSPTARGEQLSVKDFVRLATLFEKANLS